MWLNGRVLVKDVYVLTTHFPDSEKFGLVSQLRRASVSVPANIAEGAGRKTEKDFASYLYNALGSAFEVETLLILSSDLKLMPDNEFLKLLEQVQIIQKQLNNFIQKLKK